MIRTKEGTEDISVMFSKKRKFESIGPMVADNLNEIDEKIPGFGDQYVFLVKNIDKIGRLIAKYENDYREMIDSYFEENKIKKANSRKNVRPGYIKIENPHEAKLKDLYAKLITYVTDYITKNKPLKNIVDAEIEAVYNINMDAKAEKTENKNEELQFLDKHAKAVIKASYTCRLFIPALIKPLEYSQHVDINNILYSVFLHILKNYETDLDGNSEFNIINKIHKIIESRVKTTLYSNQVIWNYLENVSIDEPIMTSKIRKILIIDIIPKLEKNKNVISMFTSVIKNQIDFHFTKKFNIAYKPITFSNRDTEEDSTFDKMEQMFQHDEGLKIMMQLDVKRVINQLGKQYCPKVTHNHIRYYQEVISINPIQTNITFIMLSKLTKIPYSAFNNLNKEEYIRAVLIVKAILEKCQLRTLARILMSRPVALNKRKTINATFLKKLVMTDIFQKIQTKIYTNMTQRFKDSEYLINKIEQLAQHKYQLIPSFEEYAIANNRKVNFRILHDNVDNDTFYETAKVGEYDRNNISENYLQFVSLIGF